MKDRLSSTRRKEISNFRTVSELINTIYHRGWAGAKLTLREREALKMYHLEEEPQ